MLLRVALVILGTIYTIPGLKHLFPMAWEHLFPMA